MSLESHMCKPELIIARIWVMMHIDVSSIDDIKVTIKETHVMDFVS